MPRTASDTGRLYTITDPSRIPNVPMYLTINAAIGGIGGGTPDPNTFPQTFQVGLRAGHSVDESTLTNSAPFPRNRGI